MYKELFFYDQSISKDDVQQAIFFVINKEFNGICIPSTFIPFVKDFVQPGINFACPIDYPNGLGDKKVRTHAILSAIKKGVNTIDLVVNLPLFIRNEKRELKDLVGNLNLCNDNNTILRVMFEHRLVEKDQIIHVARVLDKIGIEYLLPSTGHIFDDPIDNLITCVNITNHTKNMHLIANGNITTKQHYDNIQKSGVFGVRFNSINIIKHVFGVYQDEDRNKKQNRI